MSGNACPSLCVRPVTNWQPVQGDSWDRLPLALVTLIWVSRNFILIPLDRITLNEHYSRRSCSSSDICICLRHKAHNILQVFCMIWDTVLYGAIFSCMMRFCREAGSKSTRIINSAQSPVMIFLEFLLCTEFFFPGLPDFTVQRLWQCAPYILLLNCFLRSSFSCVPVYFWDQTAFWSGSLSLSSLSSLEMKEQHGEAQSSLCRRS